ncbi:MAG: hypothetical protein AAB455_01795 [Patescibacteria group bacterium]
MVKYSSFRLANALIGFLIIILAFLGGLPLWVKSLIFAVFGLLVILFSLAESGGRVEIKSETKNQSGNQVNAA